MDPSQKMRKARSSGRGLTTANLSSGDHRNAGTSCGFRNGARSRPWIAKGSGCNTRKAQHSWSEASRGYGTRAPKHGRNPLPDGSRPVPHARRNGYPEFGGDCGILRWFHGCCVGSGSADAQALNAPVTMMRQLSNDGGQSSPGQSAAWRATAVPLRRLCASSRTETRGVWEWLSGTTSQHR